MFWSSFGTLNGDTGQWDFSDYGTESNPYIPVYAGCYCTLESTKTITDVKESYAYGKVFLSHPDYPEFQLICGHFINIPTDFIDSNRHFGTLSYWIPPCSGQL